MNLIVRTVVCPVILQLPTLFHTPHRREPYRLDGGMLCDPSPIYLFPHFSDVTLIVQVVVVRCGPSATYLFPHSSQTWTILSGWWYTLWSFSYLPFFKLLTGMNLIVLLVVHPIILQVPTFFPHFSRTWTLLSVWWYTILSFSYLPFFTLLTVVNLIVQVVVRHDPSATYLFHSSQTWTLSW